MMTGEYLPTEQSGIALSFQAFLASVQMLDKTTYSPRVDGRLFSVLRTDSVNSAVITDVCGRAAVLEAIDLGFRVAMISDAVGSGADETHDAAVDLSGDRFCGQLELSKTGEFLSTVPS